MEFLRRGRRRRAAPHPRLDGRHAGSSGGGAAGNSGGGSEQESGQNAPVDPNAPSNQVTRYAGAEAALRDLPGADAAYNRGNALAKQGREQLEELWSRERAQRRQELGRRGAGWSAEPKDGADD